MARSRRTRRSSSAPHCLVGVSTAGDSHTTGHNSLNSVTAAHFAADHISAPTQHPQVGPPTSPTGSGPTPPIPSSNRSGSDDSDSGVVNNLLSAISAAMFQNNIDPAEADPWTKVAKILREYDEEKIKDCKEDIDTLLVFAGLFSAVMTAFVIESYKTLQQDPADAAVLLLLQISQQLRMLAVPSVSNITSVPPGPLGDFHATPSNVRINTLWFASLICSLMTASLGILIKQWLHEYTAHNNRSTRTYLRIRHFRFQGLIDFHVFEIAAFLPMLLQIALGLFFAGLGVFLHLFNDLVAWVAIGLILAWFSSLTIMSVILPAILSRCPYKLPVLKGVMHVIRPKLKLLWAFMLSSYLMAWQTLHLSSRSSSFFAAIPIGLFQS
ncbi:unnamed protein product, partial [Somion occarium]